MHKYRQGIQIMQWKTFCFPFSPFSVQLKYIQEKGDLASATAPAYKSNGNILMQTFAVQSARCRQGGLTAYNKKREPRY